MNDRWHDIVDYLEGRGSENERRALESWRAENAEHEALFQRIVQARQTLAEEENRFEPNTDQAWHSLRGKLNAEKEPAFTVSRNRSFWVNASRIAAVIVLGLGLAWLTISQPWDTRISVKTELAQQEVTLPDGTKVWLNGHSEMRYPVDFEGDLREISLEGEAYFEVAENKAKPFVIESGQTQTRVLGTSFNLRAYDGEVQVSVTVLTGKVAFSRSGKQVVLTPGQQGIFDRESGEVTSQTAQDANVLAWKTRIFRFVETPMDEVIRAMENIYQVKIEAKNPQLLACTFTSEPAEPLTMDEVLTIFKLGSGISYQKEGDKIILDGPGCQ
jgi:transmembrane sensor